MFDEERERLTKKEVECCNLQAWAIIVLPRWDFVAATLTTLLWPHSTHALASGWSLGWHEGFWLVETELNLHMPDRAGWACTAAWVPRNSDDMSHISMSPDLNSDPPDQRLSSCWYQFPLSALSSSQTPRNAPCRQIMPSLHRNGLCRILQARSDSGVVHFSFESLTLLTLRASCPLSGPKRILRWPSIFHRASESEWISLGKSFNNVFNLLGIWGLH